MDTKELCFSLAEKNGTSGDEKVAAEYAAELLGKYMKTKIDVLGNVVGTMGEEGPHILLDAHLDRIGMVVRHIDDKGFLLIDKVGGPDLRVLTGAEVIVHGNEEIFGVISSVPPHLQSSDNKEKIDIKTMAVDIGMTKQQAEKIVNIGDRINIRSSSYELLNDCIASAGFDDRACMAAILKALEIVDGKLHNIRLSVLFSSREETSGSGASTGAFSLMPDIALAVDVGFGDDPYTEKEQTINLGGGVSIGISPTLDRELIKELKEICVKENIPYQHDVMGGRTGTNADSINVTGCGVKTALLSLPLRYMHTGNEIISIKDVDTTAGLIAAYLLKKESEQNA